MSEKSTLAEAENALRECLQRVPFLNVEGLEREVTVAGVCIDIVATVSVAAQQQRLALDVKSNGQPRIARTAAYELARVRERDPGLYGVFSAPYISPRTAEICDQEKIGYLDLAGNCRLTFGEVYIEQTCRPNLYAEKRDLRSLYSPKAARVLRVLLTDPQRAWRVQTLAKEAAVSLGQVSNVKRLLEDREWLKGSDAGLMLRDPGSLLFEWSTNLNAGKMVPRNYYSLKGIAEIENDLAGACEREGIAYALTGFSGAARYASAVRYQRVMAYVFRDREKIAEMLSLKEVDSGANVSLYAPSDEGVLYGARPIDGICIASPVQVYLDLIGMKGRGEEAARTMLDEVIKRTW